MAEPTPFLWDEAILTPEQRLHYHHVLVTLIAFDQARSSRAIGTGFVIEPRGETAIGCTAAHNFAGIRTHQNPRSAHHPSTPREFLTFRPVDLAGDAVRALAFGLDGSPEMATIDWAVFDETVDIAFFSMTAQDSRGGADFFQKNFALTDAIPAIGDEVCVFGYRNAQAISRPGETEEFLRLDIRRDLVLRRGRIVEHHDRHVLSKGPCVETSIPVFPGMSGGPVFALPQGKTPGPQVFGVISSDLESDDKMDRSQSGSSIVPLLAPKVTTLPNGEWKAVITLPNARIVDDT